MSIKSYRNISKELKSLIADSIKNDIKINCTENHFEILPHSKWVVDSVNFNSPVKEASLNISKSELDLDISIKLKMENGIISVKINLNSKDRSIDSFEYYLSESENLYKISLRNNTLIHNIPILLKYGRSTIFISDREEIIYYFSLQLEIKEEGLKEIDVALDSLNFPFSTRYPVTRYIQFAVAAVLIIFLLYIFDYMPDITTKKSRPIQAAREHPIHPKYWGQVREIYIGEFKPYENVITPSTINTRGKKESETSENKIYMMMVKYMMKDYRSVVETYEDVVKTDPSLIDQKIKLYIGISYLAIEETRLALTLFQEILDYEGADNPFIEQARWYQGLTFLKDFILQPTGWYQELTYLQQEPRRARFRDNGREFTYLQLEFDNFVIQPAIGWYQERKDLNGDSLEKARFIFNEIIMKSKDDNIYRKKALQILDKLK